MICGSETNAHRLRLIMSPKLEAPRPSLVAWLRGLVMGRR